MSNRTTIAADTPNTSDAVDRWLDGVTTDVREQAGVVAASVVRILSGIDDTESIVEPLRNLAAVSYTLEHAADRLEHREAWATETATMMATWETRSA